MMTVRSIDELVEFDVNITLYLSESANDSMIRPGEASSDSIGFLIGELFLHQGKEYALVTKVIQDVQHIDVATKGAMILGWYYEGTGAPQEQPHTKLEERMLDQPHHFVFQVDLTTGSVQAFQPDAGVYSPIIYRTVDDYYSMDTFDDMALIHEELSEIEGTKVFMNRMILTSLTLLFGLFGGVMSFIVSDERKMALRAVYIVFGAISTVFWLMLGKIM